MNTTCVEVGRDEAEFLLRAARFYQRVFPELATPGVMSVVADLALFVEGGPKEPEGKVMDFTSKGSGF